MELSERYIQQLENEGFTTVYEHTDAPGAVYPPHIHEEKSVVIVTDGSITFSLLGEEKTLTIGKRIDIPAKLEHSAEVSSEGCHMVVGEIT